MSFLIAAPASGSGKTTVTLGILRALTRTGIAVRGAKSGPDYIDPHFHAAATGQPCLNLDAWAMSPARIRSLAQGDTPLIVEAAMGLFDGAANGEGSAATLAGILDIPVVLVIDVARMSQSIKAVIHGFSTVDPATRVAGVILNNAGSARHADMLRAALPDTNIIGIVPRDPALHHPSRHLGLVQAQEHTDLGSFLDRAADLITTHCNLAALPALIAPSGTPQTPPDPPAQIIAIAQDAAFAFCYPHLLHDWQNAGATLQLFSPLNNDPAPQADLIYLPGGYPELHAGTLATNHTFLQSIKDAAATTQIYGECGGYMVLGKTLTDANGESHAMAGLLDLETSFAKPRRHLGYRQLQATTGPFAGNWRGHEFHYATTLRANGTPLFTAQDAAGAARDPMGLIAGKVCGSFAHIIDRVR
ncbi:cobyrinic acid a,c-diamide synthase [Cognatiyoonia koreensis]|uniref:Cobyrinic acid a,c-diamide synthase n=1 Tax=Cognatiyoonia koreensis TaxID=364200 RepID=A0A1I0PJ42_9RHOB|nr:cobyrinate a,c-diamide synthase [Cognatiyoonia koreensis]SEW13797.1 cobyrinic acid a,c-diamide synthase [Cognatiyoonia koreensis]